MKTWNTIAFLALVLVCGLNIVAMIRRVPPQPRAPSLRKPNPVLEHEQRMAGVRQALQELGTRGTVGYLADVPAAQLESHPHGIEEFYLTQFALVPLVLDAQGEGCRWWVANLHASPARPIPAEFRVAHDFGAGVMLLERLER